MIIGTAGHVDHGKTALVRALTGVDTDRLPDERRRGITIDLGFAPFRLGDGRTASIVDVPGHESLVHTMIAGSSGIKVALVVVAADEGVMPQTREHLRVLTALGVRSGVVALSKADLAEPAALDNIERDVRAVVATSSLGSVTPIAVSARDGRGIAELRDALVARLDAATAAPADDLFRCFVDRAFVVRGTGTVVTGTVASGSVAVGNTVTVLPGGLTTRVRGIEAHGVALTSATAGTRAALALADVVPADVPRGAVVVTSGAWAPATRLIAEITLFGVRALPRSCMLHLGGASAVARLAALGDLRDGMAIVARVSLDRPMVARRGDRFVLRSTGPSDTIGGGVVLDPAPERGARAPIAAAGTPPAEVVRAMLIAAGGAGVEPAALPLRAGIPSGEVEGVVASADAVVIGGRLLSRAWYDALGKALVARVGAWCGASALADGMPLAELRSELRARESHATRPSNTVVDAALRDAVTRGEVMLSGSVVVPRDRPSLSPADSAVLARLLHRVRDGGREPPTVAELTSELGAPVPDLLTFAARSGNLLRVEGVRYYSAEIVAGVIADLRRKMVPGRAYSPSELRDVVGVSRKYLIPLLEYLDAAGVMNRDSGGRTIRTVSSARDPGVGSNNRSGAA